MNNLVEPTKWVIIKINSEPLYKIFASWAGGYLNGDEYRLNSGIKKVIIEDEYYIFEGYSNSRYKCRKDSYGVISLYNKMVLEKIVSLNSEIEKVDETNINTVINEINQQH